MGVDRVSAVLAEYQRAQIGLNDRACAIRASDGRRGRRFVAAALVRDTERRHTAIAVDGSYRGYSDACGVVADRSDE